MSEEQIKPKDWAESHGVKVDVVMKLLRDAGVAVRTHMSKVDAADYAKSRMPLLLKSRSRMPVTKT